MFLIVAKYLIPKDYRGLAIFPFVFVKYRVYKKNLVFLNHERIHLKQQIEMLFFPFFIWYTVEFLLRYFQFKNWNLAYRNISFEREAYANEKNLDYIRHRTYWGFLKYI